MMGALVCCKCSAAKNIIVFKSTSVFGSTAQLQMSQEVLFHDDVSCKTRNILKHLKCMVFKNGLV